MVNYAKNFVLDIEPAEDIAQDTFITFWENRKKKPFLFSHSLCALRVLRG